MIALHRSATMAQFERGVENRSLRRRFISGGPLAARGPCSVLGCAVKTPSGCAIRPTVRAWDEQGQDTAMHPTTRWSLVIASRGAGKGARDALAELCERYRPVVLAHFRRHDAAHADDDTQSFFLHFLEQRLQQRADPLRGSFRAFLFAAAQNHRRERIRAESAAKRRGIVADDPDAIERLVDERAELSRRFDRDWALRVLACAYDCLRDEASRTGKLDLFNALEPFLVELPENDSYGAAGAPLGLSANAVAAAVKRLRDRFRMQVRRELADTLGEDANLDLEMAWLRAALRPDPS
jgi:DNA-directed RNA polymerase specialized sigma24 family protein